MNMEQSQNEIQVLTSDNDNFSNLYPDTFQGFINFITQDRIGQITQHHRRFNNALYTIYYNMTPGEFYNAYINFLNMINIRERYYRNFLVGFPNETIENCIQRIYNKTHGSHNNPEDHRDPRFVFAMNLWLELWN